MEHFLPQINIKKTLIESVVLSLGHIQNEQIKNDLIDALKPFKDGIALDVVDIEQVIEHANKNGFSLNRDQAIEILKSICLDIKFNCVGDSVSYHFDEFISDKDELELKNLCSTGATSLTTQNQLK